MRVDATEVTEGGNDEVRAVYRKVFADCGMSLLFAERDCQLFFEKGDDYTK